MFAHEHDHVTSDNIQYHDAIVQSIKTIFSVMKLKSQGEPSSQEKSPVKKFCTYILIYEFQIMKMILNIVVQCMN